MGGCGASLARTVRVGYTRAMASTVGRIAALWRYPVKSLRGEEIRAAEVTANGIAGDRAYALRDRKTGRVMSAKRFARLFEGCHVRAHDLVRGRGA